MVPLLMAGLVFAAAETPPQPPPKSVSPVISEAPHKPKPSDPVCHQETPTGSHFSATVCETRLEAEARTRRDQKALDPTLRNVPKSFTH